MVSVTLEKISTPSRVFVMSFASLCFAVLIGLSALIRIPVPFTPIPITLQTFTLLLGAGILGRWYSIQMVFWYIALGVLGVPFFAEGTGIQVIAGPTGGYIFGFILASMILGFSEKKSTLTFLIATIMIYVPGVLWLKIISSANWISVLKMGILPFILFDIIKAMTAYSSAKGINYLFKR